MKELRSSSFEEFITWYLEREARKKGRPAPNFLSYEDKLKEFKTLHSGKLFPDPMNAESMSWSIIELDAREEAEQLICLASDWTRHAGLLPDENKQNSRLLKNYVLRTKEIDYFNPENTKCHRQHLCYLEQFRKKPFALNNINRVVLRTPTEGEHNNNLQGWYYLHDGIGRLLPYMYTVFFEDKPFLSIEAFVAEEA